MPWQEVVSIHWRLICFLKVLVRLRNRSSSVSISHAQLELFDTKVAMRAMRAWGPLGDLPGNTCEESGRVENSQRHGGHASGTPWEKNIESPNSLFLNWGKADLPPEPGGTILNSAHSLPYMQNLILSSKCWETRVQIWRNNLLFPMEGVQSTWMDGYCHNPVQFNAVLSGWA